MCPVCLHADTIAQRRFVPQHEPSYSVMDDSIFKEAWPNYDLSIEYEFHWNLRTGLLRTVTAVQVVNTWPISGGWLLPAIINKNDNVTLPSTHSDYTCHPIPKHEHPTICSGAGYDKLIESTAKQNKIGMNLAKRPTIHKYILTHGAHSFPLSSYLVNMISFYECMAKFWCWIPLKSIYQFKTVCLDNQGAEDSSTIPMVRSSIFI